MKTTRIIIALLTVAALAAATERARFTPTTASTIEVTGSSTVHEWKMEGKTIAGAIDIAPEVAADPTKAESWKSDKAALVTVTIPVANIKSEHAKMDNVMLDAMKARQYPDVKYELTQATPVKGTAESFLVHTKGKITIAGVTRDLDMDVSAAKTGAKTYVITGEAPMTMTSFGIKPPTAMLGTIKSGDAIKVSFRWVVDRTE
jgi:polyisoprenoid-binding protein YceI